MTLLFMQTHLRDSYLLVQTDMSICCWSADSLIHQLFLLPDCLIDTSITKIFAAGLPPRTLSSLAQSAPPLPARDRDRSHQNMVLKLSKYGY